MARLESLNAGMERRGLAVGAATPGTALKRRAACSQVTTDMELVHAGRPGRSCPRMSSL